MIFGPCMYLLEIYAFVLGIEIRLYTPPSIWIKNIHIHRSINFALQEQP